VLVVPGFEWAFILHVGEVMVPFEFGNAGGPLGAQRKQGEDAERGDDDRAHARGVVVCTLLHIWGRRRSGEADDFCGAGGGHDPRQVFGI
jgi:hypothetical protein